MFSSPCCGRKRFAPSPVCFSSCAIWRSWRCGSGRRPPKAKDRRGPFGVSRLVRLSGSTNRGPSGGGRDSESQIRDPRGDTEGAFAKAAHIVKRRYVISRVYAHFMEPRGAIGVWDPGEDRFTLYADVQYPHRVRQALATRIFKIPESKIRVTIPTGRSSLLTRRWREPDSNHRFRMRYSPWGSSLVVRGPFHASLPKTKFAADSALEGDGFEPSVPRPQPASGGAALKHTRHDTERLTRGPQTARFGQTGTGYLGSTDDFQGGSDFMATDLSSDLLRAVWEYPLFDALYGRRTRRFGLGFEMAQGPYQYRSSQAPVPLCEDEEALLVAAGIGFSGMALWDQSRPLPYRNSDGRTFPSTARSPHGAVFYKRPRRVRHRPGRGLSRPDESGRPPGRTGRDPRPLPSPPLDLTTAPAGHSASRAAPLRAQFVGLEHARIDAVHRDLRCHLFADRSDRAICRRQARTFRAGERTRHQHRRRPVPVSASRHRGLDQEWISESRQQPGVDPPRASGLLLHV